MSGRAKRREGVSRRQLLRAGTGGAAAVAFGTGAVSGRRPYAAPPRVGDPFALGVASGDPTPDGVVLWTRLAPDPFAPDGFGGMPDRTATVDYEIADDERFASIVRRGSATATRALAHSVHVEVAGLAPDRVYHYRFRYGDALSATGRTRTAPLPGSRKNLLRFAFASCQAWHDGYYTAYEHLAAEDLDLVVHLGDYIYEYGLGRNRRGVEVEPQFLADARDLPRYRLQYARYKAEQPLQDAHAAFAWISTFDDHEVADDWAGDSPSYALDTDLLPGVFRRRKAAALQAMYEHQPLRRAQLPVDGRVTMHRRFAFGDLAELTMLDTRQYRDRQACGDGTRSDCAARSAGDRTILGARQRDWLIGGLATSAARWQVLGNQVPMLQSDDDPGPAVDVSMDSWDGYVADRNRVLGAAADAGVANLVVITGDRHQNYAADLRRDCADPASPVVGTEFVGTSITSGGNGSPMYDEGERLLAANPDLKFFDGDRGYVRVSVSPELWRTDFRTVPYVERPGAPVRTAASYVVADRSAAVERL